MRNIQLAGPAVLIGAVSAYAADAGKLAEGGFLQGYTRFTWAVVLLHSGGGILVCVCVCACV